MKKLLAILLAAVMVALMAVSAYAAPQNFISSPGAENAPVIVEYEVESEECEAELVLTPYSEHETLFDELDEDIVGAYNQLTSTADLTTLSEALAELAERSNIPASDLAVSDLFDLHYYNCDLHDVHGDFKIKLKAEALENFVGLLHLADDGWELIEGARVEDVEYLVFSIDDFSPFAIVVDSGDDSGAADYPENPGTLDSIEAVFHQYCSVIVIALFAIILVLTASCISLRKKNKNLQNKNS